MDEIKFKITLKVNDLYYFMMHHYYSKPAGIIGLVLSLGSLVKKQRIQLTMKI